MNILDKNDTQMPVFGRKDVTVSREKKFSWSVPAEPGKFMWIPKEDLNIDGVYQRDATSKARVLRIAREFSWLLFGIVVVIKRDDGTLWVIDGGHRVRACFLRSDIKKVPCMVFSGSKIEDEAKAFYGINLFTSIVSSYHKHHAALVAREPDAQVVESIVEKHGYKIVQSATMRRGFAAVRTLRRMAVERRDLADAVFGLCAEMAEDWEPISGDVLFGIFTCAKKVNGNFFHPAVVKRLKDLGLQGVLAGIRRERYIAGRGGEKVDAKAVLDMLNKGRRKRLTWEE